MNKDLLEKARQQGDVHPNGKWYWETSARGGKGDWRVIKKDSNASKTASVKKTPTKPSAQQVANAKARGQGKPMSVEQLMAWAPKTDESNLLKVVNGKNNNTQARKVAWDELDKRGYDMSKIDTSGGLGTMLGMTKNKTTTKTKVQTDDSNDVTVNTDNITENWWLNKTDSRVKKMFNNLQSKQDRIKYDKFLYKKKKSQPDYEDPVDIMYDLNEQYLEFLVNNEQRFMISAGGAGVGKSYGFEKLAEALNKKPFNPAIDKPGEDDYDYIEASDIDSKKKLLNLLKAHNGKIILFDDTDSVITRKDLASIMKKATSMSGKRIVGDPDDANSNFEFTGRIIIMTNKDLTTLSENEDTKAIISRASQVSEIYMTVDETIGILEERFQKMNIPAAPRLDDEEEDFEERKELFDLIKNNKNNIDPSNFTTRTFGSMLSTKRRIDRGAEFRSKGSLFTDFIGTKTKDWKKEALKTLIKADDDELSNDSGNSFIKAKDVLSDFRRKRAEDDGVDYTIDDYTDEDIDDVQKAEDLLLGDDGDVFADLFEKGVYQDNAENRKLGRVGQTYGGNKNVAKTNNSNSKVKGTVAELERQVKGYLSIPEGIKYHKALSRLEENRKSAKTYQEKTRLVQEENDLAVLYSSYRKALVNKINNIKKSLDTDLQKAEDLLLG